MGYLKQTATSDVRALAPVRRTVSPCIQPSPLPVLDLCLESLGVFWVNEVHDPCFLHHRALTSFLHGRGGETGTQMESTLSRLFSNYTLETNQPEHCFLISRTKQIEHGLEDPGGHTLPSGTPQRWASILFAHSLPPGSDGQAPSDCRRLSAGEKSRHV